MNLKVRKRIRYPGQGKRPPFSDEAEYDLRDGLLDPVYARGRSTRRRPPPDPVEPAAPLSFSISGNGAKADVLIVGAGAGGSVAARHLAEAGFKVVCLEQGGWENAADFPGDKLEWELVADAQFSPNPNVDGIPPTTRSRSRARRSRRSCTTRSAAARALLRPVGAAAPAGLQAPHAARARRRLAHLLRGDEALLRADRPGDADLRHGRRPELPARAAAAPAAAPIGPIGRRAAEG